MPPECKREMATLTQSIPKTLGLLVPPLSLPFCKRKGLRSLGYCMRLNKAEVQVIPAVGQVRPSANPGQGRRCEPARAQPGALDASPRAGARVNPSRRPQPAGGVRAQHYSPVRPRGPAPSRAHAAASHPEPATAAERAAMSGEPGPMSVVPPPGEVEPGSGVRIVVEYCEPCGFEATYLELASAVKEQYPGIEIESRLGGTGAFEIEINGQLVFSKLENGGFPYEKDLIEAIRRASNGEPLEKITNSRPPCVIL